jgi:glyoxylate reductase
MVRAGQFKGWNPNMLVGADFQGRTLGLVGFGRIARAVARRAAGFRMRLLHTARSAPDAEAEEIGSHRVSLERLLKESDFLSLHVPLTSDTRHLIDETALRAMKKTAYLINTSRGPVVDEAALARALKEGRLAGAALDVFEHEPLAADSPLRQMSNVILTPHAAYFSSAAVAQVPRRCGEEVARVLTKERPLHVVNPEVYAPGHRRRGP